MYRRLTGSGMASFSGFIPLKTDNKDGSYNSKYGGMDYEEFVSRKSGLDRLRVMFSVDEHDTLSKEVSAVLQSCFFGTFFGACYGGFVRSRVSYFDFIDNNQATSFYSNFDAKKKLQHQVTMGFARGALQWGWRLGFFVGTFTFFSTTISVYRGKSSMLEYIVAGTATGSIYKLNHGLRGIVVGGGLGFILGCIGGGISLAILSLTGTNMDEIRYWQNYWKESRNRQYNIALDNCATEKHDPLITHHDLKLTESGITTVGITSDLNELKN